MEWVQPELRSTVELLSCFTDRGTVQKVIVLPRDDLQTEELVLEEVEVFKVSLLNLFYLLLVLSFCPQSVVWDIKIRRNIFLVCSFKAVVNFVTAGSHSNYHHADFIKTGMLLWRGFDQIVKEISKLLRSNQTSGKKNSYIVIQLWNYIILLKIVITYNNMWEGFTSQFS